jgi:hypothetical protein
LWLFLHSYFIKKISLLKALSFALKRNKRLWHSQGSEWISWTHKWWSKMFNTVIESLANEPVQSVGVEQDCHYLITIFNNAATTLDSSVFVWKKFVINKHSKNLWAKPLGRGP